MSRRFLALWYPCRLADSTLTRQVAPPLIWVEFTYRVMSYDRATTMPVVKNASKQIREKNRASAVGIGVFSGSCFQCSASLIWASGAMFVVLHRVMPTSGCTRWFCPRRSGLQSCLAVALSNCAPRTTRWLKTAQRPSDQILTANQRHRWPGLANNCSPHRITTHPFRPHIIIDVKSSPANALTNTRPAIELLRCRTRVVVRYAHYGVRSIAHHRHFEQRVCSRPGIR
jgi:hypothetical protein